MVKADEDPSTFIVPVISLVPVCVISNVISPELTKVILLVEIPLTLTVVLGEKLVPTIDTVDFVVILDGKTLVTV